MFARNALLTAVGSVSEHEARAAFAASVLHAGDVESVTGAPEEFPGERRHDRLPTSRRDVASLTRSVRPSGDEPLTGPTITTRNRPGRPEPPDAEEDAAHG